PPFWFRARKHETIATALKPRSYSVNLLLVE
ncbi:MAG: hypothetical protein ACI8R4_004307, partial [Paracoccaceae bacterium]